MLKTVVTFDNGNSHPHVALYQEGKRFSLHSVEEFLARYPYQDWKNWSFIVSHVGQETEFTQKVFSLPTTKKVKDFRNKDQMFTMAIHYQESLGDDRLVQAYALFKNYPERKNILIDAGTFITIDVIENKGFLGGYIFPGLNTFFKSYGQGAHLPTLTPSELPWNNTELPHSTPEAILKAGTLYLDSVLASISKQHPDAHFTITGGSGQVVKDRLTHLNIKNISINPFLIHDALYELGQEK